MSDLSRGAGKRTAAAPEQTPTKRVKFDPEAVSPAAQANDSGGALAETTEAKAKAKGKAKAKAKATLFKDINRVKASYTNATQRADEILRETKSAGKFQWARDNQRGDKMVMERLDSLREEVSEWGREFLVAKDLKFLKSQYDEATMNVEMQKFVGLEKKVEKLAAACEAIVRASDTLLSMDSQSAI